MARLPHLHLIHPKEHLGRVETAEEPATEEIRERRLEGIAEIDEYRVRGQSLERGRRHSKYSHLIKVMLLDSLHLLSRSE